MDKIEVSLDFGAFPDRFTCSGEDISPRLIIKGAKGLSMAIILDDPDAPMGIYTHWVIWNLPIVETIPENVPKAGKLEEPLKAVQGRNTSGELGYMGPCPPRGKPHRYYFKVYVLDKMLSLAPGASKKELEKAMEGHVLQYGEAMATYGR